MIELETLDRITSIVGERKMGKSTLAKLDWLEFQRETGGYGIGHSPDGVIGAEDYISFHDGLVSLEKGLRKRPERLHIVASGATPEEVIEFQRSLAEALKKRAIKNAGHKYQKHRPAPRGVMAPPVHCLIDEGTYLEKYPERKLKNPTKATVKTDARMEQFLTNARHEHCSVTWLTQAPSARTWTLFEQSSRFRLFRYLHQYGRNGLHAAGVPIEAVRALPHLRPLEYIQFDKERSEVWSRYMIEFE